MTVQFAGRPKPDPASCAECKCACRNVGLFPRDGRLAETGTTVRCDDSVGAPLAAVVNEAFTRQIDGARSPIGMQVEAAEAGAHKYATIVGVVADARQDMNESVKPELLLNLDQMSPA